MLKYPSAGDLTTACSSWPAWHLEWQSVPPVYQCVCVWMVEWSVHLQYKICHIHLKMLLKPRKIRWNCWQLAKYPLSQLHIGVCRRFQSLLVLLVIDKKYHVILCHDSGLLFPVWKSYTHVSFFAFFPLPFSMSTCVSTVISPFEFWIWIFSHLIVLTWSMSYSLRNCEVLTTLKTWTIPESVPRSRSTP